MHKHMCVWAVIEKFFIFFSCFFFFFIVFFVFQNVKESHMSAGGVDAVFTVHKEIGEQMSVRLMESERYITVVTTHEKRAI